MRSVEAVPLRKVNEDVVINFLQEKIMTRFGVPISLVFDNVYYFSSIKITEFASETRNQITLFLQLLSMGKWVSKINKQKSYQNSKEDCY